MIYADILNSFETKTLYNIRSELFTTPKLCIRAAHRTVV